jgi:hypothetical protein
MTASALLLATCATRLVAGYLDAVSDQSEALLFRGKRSGCLLDPG